MWELVRRIYVNLCESEWGGGKRQIASKEKIFLDK
jgi:hypothetical protein